MTDRPIAAGRVALRVEGLSVNYRVSDGEVTALRDVSFAIGKGEVVALVGESGSGKSTIAHAVLGLLPPSAEITSGTIFFDGKELTGLTENAWRRVRGRTISLVPQDPTLALNPVHRIERQTVEPLRIHRLVRDRHELHARAVSLLSRVGIDQPEVRARQFPGSLSGGMRQRVMIASALAAGPMLLIADEPTTALDVTVQKRILDDLETLTRADGLSVLLVTHDLALAADRADRVVVLKNGRVVEAGPVREVLRRPQAAYTSLLIRSASSGGARFRSRAADVVDKRGEEVIRVEAVAKEYPLPHGSVSRQFLAVDGVSLHVRAGETVGVVGESGSGKTTLGRLVLGLTPPTSGRVLYRGKDLAARGSINFREFRRRVQLIYQNPFSSLNPRLNVAQIIREPLDGFQIGDPDGRQREVERLVERVGLTGALLRRKPGELSGGQRQRVAIARALAPQPELIVCDEPLSSLDVTVQAQILELLAELQSDRGLSYLFVSHDLSVVRRIADRVLVMRSGKVVEAGATEPVFDTPRHEYTRELLAAIPGAGFFDSVQPATASQVSIS